MQRALSAKFALLVAVACAVDALASCSGDGVTTSCPPLPLYDTYPLGDASRPDAQSEDSAPVQKELAAAVKAGCLTAPSNGTVASGEAGRTGADEGGNAGAFGK